MSLASGGGLGERRERAGVPHMWSGRAWKTCRLLFLEALSMCVMHLRVCICVHECADMRVRMCVFMCMCEYACVCMSECVSVHVYACAHMYPQ